MVELNLNRAIQFTSRSWAMRVLMSTSFQLWKSVFGLAGDCEACAPTSENKSPMQRHMTRKRVRLFHDALEETRMKKGRQTAISLCSFSRQHLRPLECGNQVRWQAVPLFELLGAVARNRDSFTFDSPSMRIDVYCIANEFAKELIDRGESCLILDAVC
jgi:hypothetical protein